MAISTTVTGLENPAEFGLKGYIPELYSPKLREKFWYASIFRKITNNEFQGGFKNKGDTIKVRQMPNVDSKPFTATTDIEYQDLTAEWKSYTINKGRYYAFKIYDVQQAFSDIPNWANKWTDDGAKNLAEAEERELFAEIGSGVVNGEAIDAGNMGKNAGKQSGIYDLGTSTEPVSLYFTDAKASAGTKVGTAGDKTTAIELATRMAAALDEQKGGAGATPFIVIPVWMAQMIQNSDVFSAANIMGDDTSILRKNACNSIGKISGMDVYVSNLLPVDTASVEGRKVYPIIFGDNTAITYADEMSKTEVLRSEGKVCDLHRSIHIYDWFLRYPERLGVAYVTSGK